MVMVMMVMMHVHIADTCHRQQQAQTESRATHSSRHKLRHVPHTATGRSGEQGGAACLPVSLLLCEAMQVSECLLSCVAMQVCECLLLLCGHAGV